MSGYFLRIARQAGARIAGDGGQRAGTPTAKTEFAPIDQAETIMVPPQASSDVTAPRRLGPNVAAPVQDQTRGQSMPERSTSAIDPATEKSPAEVNRLIPLEPVREEVKLIAPAAIRDPSHVTVSTSSRHEEPKIETPKPIEMAESAKTIHLDLRTAETLPEKFAEKKFFEKTVELVAGQTARPVEVHTILLREVQEWIAAGQNAPDEVTDDVADSAAEPLADTSLPSERKPGVVRIVEGRRAKPAPEVVQKVSTTNFTEQNLELSIGSISVVVEGDERAPPPAPAQAAAQRAARETPQRTSRLSRHYL